MLRSTLKELGIADNTMVWFTSDNGPNLKGKKDVRMGEAQGGKFAYTPIGSTGAYRGWKRDCYEGGLIVPGILEWPAKVRTPRTTRVRAVTSDYFPTALAAAGLPLPGDRAYDGINLLPLIEGDMAQRPGAIGFHCNGMQAWTGPKYKIVRTIKKKRGGSEGWELYDLIADPWEGRDLGGEHPEIVQRMALEFAAWAQGIADEKNR